MASPMRSRGWPEALSERGFNFGQDLLLRVSEWLLEQDVQDESCLQYVQVDELEDLQQWPEQVISSVHCAGFAHYAPHYPRRSNSL